MKVLIIIKIEYIKIGMVTKIRKPNIHRAVEAAEIIEVAIVSRSVPTPTAKTKPRAYIQYFRNFELFICLILFVLIF